VDLVAVVVEVVDLVVNVPVAPDLPVAPLPKVVINTVPAVQAVPN
jgi:hypothetical protein